MNFVKRIDPANKSRTLIIAAFLLEVVFMILSTVATLAIGGTTAQAVAALGLLVFPAVLIMMYVAIFKVRTSMVNYYNSVEPIQLRLSGVMTFFFNFYYFQHHFTRIATWKKTGQLTPQS